MAGSVETPLLVLNNEAGRRNIKWGKMAKAANTVSTTWIAGISLIQAYDNTRTIKNHIPR
jgi:hypothetical protein